MAIGAQRGARGRHPKISQEANISGGIWEFNQPIRQVENTMSTRRRPEESGACR